MRNEKSFPYQRLSTRFDTETRGNSEMACCSNTIPQQRFQFNICKMMANKSGIGIDIFWPAKSRANTTINYNDKFTSGFVCLYIFFEWVLTKLGYAKAEFPIITRPICK